MNLLTWLKPSSSGAVDVVDEESLVVGASTETEAAQQPVGAQSASE